MHNKTREQLEKEITGLRTQLAERKLFEVRNNWTVSRIRLERRELETIFHRLPNGISVISSDHEVLFQNKWMTDRFGNKLGKVCYEEYMHRDSPCAECMLGRALGCDRTVYHRTIQMRERHYKVIDASIGRFEGKEAIIEMIIDITLQKQSEEVLKRQKKFIENAIDALEYPFYIVNLDYTIALANKIAREKGMREGGYCYEFTHNRKDPCNNNHDCLLREVVRTKKPVQLEHAHYDNEGNRVLVEVHGDPIFDKNGELIQMIETTIDVTKRKQAEEEIKTLNKKLQQLALRDSHTGLYNYRYLLDISESELDRAKRYIHPLSAIMLDIDYFKPINDVYGHKFGDLVLKQLAGQLKKAVRQYDSVIRFGGEEFVIISPRTNRSQALALAQRILDAVRSYDFGDKKNTAKLKASLAVASYPEDPVTKGMCLVELADTILKKVKEDGGNRIYSSLDTRQDKGAVLEENKESTGVQYIKNKVEKLTERVNNSLTEELYAFAKMSALKNGYGDQHIKNVHYYSVKIAESLGMPDEQIETIRKASILHDLGKIGVPSEILNKKSRLTDEEFDEVRKYPQVSVNIVASIQFLHDAIPLILYHRERWDAKGYPEGLRGNRIPIGARIIAIVDAYCALISTRPYREAYSKKEAMEIIKENSGSQFDPRIVDVFLKILQSEKEPAVLAG